MDQSHWRAAGVAGIVFAAANTSVAIATGQPPAVDATGAAIRTYFVDHRSMFIAGVVVFALTVPLFVWFISALADRMGESQERSPAGSAVLAAGVAWLAVFAAANVGALAVVLVTPLTSELGDDLIRYSWLVTNLLGVIANALAAVAMLASGVGFRRVGAPAWLSRSSTAGGAIVLGLSGIGLTSASAMAGAAWGYVLVTAWIVATGIHFIRAEPSAGRVPAGIALA